MKEQTPGYQPSFEALMLARTEGLPDMKNRLDDLHEKMQSLVEANIRQEAVNAKVTKLEGDVGKLKDRAVFIRGGLKTLSLIGAGISAILLAVYHIVSIVFASHKS